jgi:hypothetical protein
MIRRRQYGRLLAAAGALCALLAPGAARADLVTVIPTVTMNGSLYHYDYAITNNAPEDLAIVSIPVLPGPDTIQNLSVPDGFVGSFDSGLGFVDFLGDVDMDGNQVVFGQGTTLSGFMFDSPFAPGPGVFQALSVSGTSFVGSTSAPVPEPGSFALMGAAATSGLFALRRRRAARR